MPIPTLRQRVGATSATVTHSAHGRAAPCPARYRCCHCRRRFSDQTFLLTYWLKRPELLLPTFHGLLSCSCLRQIARAGVLAADRTAARQPTGGATASSPIEQLRPGASRVRGHGWGSSRSSTASSIPPATTCSSGGELLPAWVHGHRAAPFGNDDEGATGVSPGEQARPRQAGSARHGKDCAELLCIVAPKPQSLVLHTDDITTIRCIARATWTSRTTISSRAAAINQPDLQREPERRADPALRGQPQA